MKKLYFNSTFGALALSSYLSNNNPGRFTFFNLFFDEKEILKLVQDPEAVFCLSIGSLGDIRLVENLFFIIRKNDVTPSGSPKFILGGPAFSFIDCSQFLDDYPEISFIVIGEGYQALDHLLKNGSAQRIIRGDSFKKTGNFHLQRNLDWHPDRPIPVSLGETNCSWGKCRFCHHLNLQTAQRMSVPQFCNQLLSYYHKYGWKDFYIYDNHLEPQELAEILTFLKQHNITLTLDVFGMRIRKDFISLAKLLRETGMVRTIGWGLEAYSQAVLNLYRKGIQQSMILSILQAAAKGGVKSIVYILLGLPGCRGEDYLSTYRFLREHTQKTGLIAQVLLSWFLMSPELNPKMNCRRIKLRLKESYRLNNYFGNSDEYPQVETSFRRFDHWRFQTEKWVSRDKLFLDQGKVLTDILSLPAAIYDYRSFFIANDTWRAVWGNSLNGWLRSHPPAIPRMAVSQRFLSGIKKIRTHYNRQSHAALVN